MMTSTQPCTIRERNIEPGGARGPRASSTLASNATAPVLSTPCGGGGSGHSHTSCLSQTALGDDADDDDAAASKGGHARDAEGRVHATGKDRAMSHGGWQLS